MTEKNYHRTIRSAWKVIEARLAETDGKLMEGVARTIRERFRTRGYYYSSDPIISIDAKSLSVKIAFSSKNYIVHLAYQSCNLNIPDDYEKLFVLYTGSQAPFKDNNPRKTRRQINCHRNWANLESEIDSIVSYIDKNQPQS